MPALVTGPRQPRLPGIVAELGVAGDVLGTISLRLEAVTAPRRTPLDLTDTGKQIAHPQIAVVADAAENVELFVDRAQGWAKIVVGRDRWSQQDNAIDL